MDTLRMTGVRAPYAAAPPDLHAWVESTLGSAVAQVVARVGGMSPAVAATLVLTDGRRAFVKAVWPQVNPDTPRHFRAEIQTYAALGPAQWRPSLLGTRDGDDWVAILLEDLGGRHPDYSNPDEVERVRLAVLAQIDELTPVPYGVPATSLRDSLRTIAGRLAGATPIEMAALPSWLRPQVPELLRHTLALADDLVEETFAHFDLRWDNIMARADGQPVFADWGQARRAPRWCDACVFALEWVHLDGFDRLLASCGLSRADEVQVTTFIGGFGVFLAFQSLEDAPPGLPVLPRFRAVLAEQLLAGYQRRSEVT